MVEDHRADHQRLSSSEENLNLPEKQVTSSIAPQPVQPRAPRRWNDIWEGLLRLGLGEIALRAGTVLSSIALVLLVLWVMGSFYLKGNVAYEGDLAFAAAEATPTMTIQPPAFKPQTSGTQKGGISRLAMLHTILPSRPRLEITQYEVQNGDTLFGIAEKFGLQPQSLLFGNYDTLADDPHRLQPGQKLNILPQDGAIYSWHAGDGLNGVAKFYNVSPDAIIDWPANDLNRDTLADDPHRLQPGQKLNILPQDGAIYSWHAGDGLNGVAKFYNVSPDVIIDWPANDLNRDALGDLSNPNIEVGKSLFIPGGTRPFQSWSAPLISRADPAAAKIFGPGYCGTVVDGYTGSGTFVWPTTEKWLSGYDFSPATNHWGIDVAGTTGNSIYATDSGVVVYAGWNDWGYGNVIVIDHGDGWQSLYGHLSQLFVTCGASVSQGSTIGAMGSTGRSSGPHLHFELMNASGVRVNPWNYLTK